MKPKSAFSHPARIEADGLPDPKLVLAHGRRLAPHPAGQELQRLRAPRRCKLRFQDRTPIVDVRALESAALILGQEVAGGCLQFESLAWMEGKKRP